MLRVRGVRWSYGDKPVLDGVDLDVPAGEVVGLVGPNGAGKSTLMRILFGVLTPDSGTVEWDGRPADEEARRSWGYMPQERGLYRDMRVLDQLVWIARLHGVERRTAATRSRDLLERLGLADRAEDKVEALSGGMAQRVQLAAAMVHEPAVLVLDEPFAGLDPVAVEFLSAVIGEHARAGRHLLFSSHQLDLVEELCESVTVLHHGHVVLEGKVARLKADSPDRALHVDVAVESEWIAGLGADVSTTDAAGSILRITPGTDAAEVLDAVRRHRPVADFGVRSPSLSELFLAAAGGGDVVDVRDRRSATDRPGAVR